MSTYKQNLISLLPYGKRPSKYKARKDNKGNVTVNVKKGKKKYKPLSIIRENYKNILIIIKFQNKLKIP